MLLLLTILLVSAGSAYSQSLSLDEALHRALSHNKQLTVLRNRVQESEQRVDQAKSAYLPQFKLTGSYNYLSRIPQISLTLPPPIVAPQIKTATHNVLDANLSGGYLLFDWGRRSKIVSQARVGRDLSQVNVAGAANEVTYQTIRAYATAALQQDNVNLLMRYVELSQKHLDDGKTKYANGLISQFDLLKSEIQLKTYQEQLSIARVDLKEALLTLTEVCGGDSVQLFEPSDSLLQISVNPPQTVRFDSLILQKPEVVALQKQQTLSRLSGASEQLRPTLTAVSSAGWKNNFMPEPDKMQFNFVGGLTLSYPFFDGGYSRHRQQEEVERQKSYQLDIDRIASETRRQMEIMFQELRKMDAKARITSDKLVLARKVLDIASVSYGAGLISNTDYLDAELEVEAIETQALQDRYSLLMTQLELKKTLGYFPETRN